MKYLYLSSVGEGNDFKVGISTKLNNGIDTLSYCHESDVLIDSLKRVVLDAIPQQDDYRKAKGIIETIVGSKGINLQTHVIQKRVKFKVVFLSYIELLSQENQDLGAISKLEEMKPLMKEALSTLGLKEIKRLDYSVTKIKYAIKKCGFMMYEKHDVLMTVQDVITNKFKVGRTYIEKEAKAILSDLYEGASVKSKNGEILKPKIAHLERFLNVERGRKIIDKKKVNVIKIL